MEKMMVPIREEVVVSNPRIGSPSSVAWLYLLAEFLIGAALFGSLGLLALVKSILPKPPRDLTGNVVLVTGATSTLGRSIADEFARNDCTIVCVDVDIKKLKEMTNELTSLYPISCDPRRYDETKNSIVRARGYECDLWDRNAIRSLANTINHEIGRIDVLVTCAGHTGQSIFETVNTTLMSHYWTVLAFLPSMLKHVRAHVVGVTPTSSIDDAYAGSRAAIAGLMESLGQEFGSRNSQLNFITVAPKADPRLLMQSERQVARDVVQAVSRDRCTLNTSWLSAILYRISCPIQAGITTVTRWLYTQGCDYPY